MSFRVVVVDSALRSMGGHNYTYTRSVRGAFERRGAEVVVLASRGASGDLSEECRPVFSGGAYDHPLGHGLWRDMAYIRAQSRVFAEELEHALTRLPWAPDLVFSHTPGDFELLGWKRCIARRPLPARLAVLLRYTLGYRDRSALKVSLHPFLRLRPRALAGLRRKLGSRFIFCTDSDLLTADYASVYPHPITTLPIPLDPVLFETDEAESFSERHALSRPGEVRVGYVGDARPAKGFGLLPDLVEGLAQVPDVRFVIQCPPAASGDDRSSSPPGLDDLVALARDAPQRITLINQQLSGREYATLLRSLHLVVLPYVQSSYRQATSGIFAEAVALGRPVVVPGDTWMASELARVGAGTVFDLQSPGDLAARALEAVEGLPALVKRAEDARRSWRNFHNPDSLVERLLGAAGLDPTDILTG